MHELSYTIRIIDQALSYFDAHPLGEGEWVERVGVRVGALTGVLPEYLMKYYRESIPGTLLSRSELTVEPVPVRILCADCGREYEPNAKMRYRCPICGSKKGQFRSGKEFIIDQIQIHHDDDTAE